MRIRSLFVASLTLALIVAMSPGAHAIHWYRGPGGGCTPAEGHITDDPTEPAPGPDTAEIKLLHNTFNDLKTGLPTTTIKVGEAVKWTWNSAHCHSVGLPNTAFDSGFHYPRPEPTTPRGVPGFFDYPVLEEVASLWFTHTFRQAGTFMYSCVHHETIGMVGQITVE